MTENAKTNAVLRALFALPISAGHRLGAFLLWGMLLPEDPRAQKKARARRWADRNPHTPEENRIRTQEWRQKNPKRAKELSYQTYWDDPELAKTKCNLWAKENPDYFKQRRKEDIHFKISKNLRKRVWDALNGKSKSARTLELLDMELPEFRVYIQGQFRPGMTWENYGPAWHIDHVRPCASFDLSDSTQQRECFYWSNLQPLFAKENLEKGAKYVSIG